MELRDNPRTNPVVSTKRLYRAYSWPRASAPAGMYATWPGRVIAGTSDGSGDRSCDILALMSFSRAQDVALVREIEAASSLFRHGFAILAEYRFALRDAEPVFACLAAGVEKLLKLSFGLATIDDGNPWPTAATMKNVGHRIVALDATVRGLLVQRRARSTAPGLIAELLERTDGHLGIGQMLGTLERYADQGRFYTTSTCSAIAHKGARLRTSCGKSSTRASRRPIPRSSSNLPGQSTSRRVDR
jgi:hypothetical protein